MSDLSDGGESDSCGSEQERSCCVFVPAAVASRAARLHARPAGHGHGDPGWGGSLSLSFTLFSLCDSLRLLVYPGRAPRARYNNNRRQTSCTSASRHAAANGLAALTEMAALHQ